MNKYILIVLLIFTCSVAKSESRKYSPSEMLEDLDYYYQLIKTCHPNLYCQYSKTTFDNLYSAIREKCAQTTLDSIDFHFLMARFNHFNDLHTNIRDFFGNMPLEYVPKRFPAIFFRGEEGFLDKNKILKIGNIKWKDLMQGVDQTLSWEYNPLIRDEARNEFFSAFMKYNYGIVPPYQCVLLTETGDTLVVTIQAVEHYEMKQKSSNNGYWNQKVHKGILQQQFFDKDSIAVLYYNSSTMSKEEELVFKNQLELFFDSVKTKQIKYLFIDASDNGGGNDTYHDYIYQYLKFNLLKCSVLSTYTYEGMGAFTQYFNGEAAYANFQKKYAAYKEGNKKIQETYSFKKEGSEDGFAGKVYLIMGRATFSAGFDFCEWFKMGNMGLLVGEPAGQRSPYSGDVVNDRMPNSKIPFRYATLFTEYKEKKFHVVGSDGFLHPDIPYPLIAPLELSDFKKIIELSEGKWDKR